MWCVNRRGKGGKRGRGTSFSLVEKVVNETNGADSPPPLFASLTNFDFSPSLQILTRIREISSKGGRERRRGVFHDRDEFENSRRFCYAENWMLLLIERSHECGRSERRKKNDFGE